MLAGFTADCGAKRVQIPTEKEQKELVMKCVSLFILLFVAILGCEFRSPTATNVPEPIRVLENPETGERVRFYREVPFKVPADYDEAKHLALWNAEQSQLGFTKEVTPEDDRAQLAEIHRKNLAESSKPSR